MFKAEKTKTAENTKPYLPSSRICTQQVVREFKGDGKKSLHIRERLSEELERVYVGKCCNCRDAQHSLTLWKLLCFGYFIKPWNSNLNFILFSSDLTVLRLRVLNVDFSLWVF